MSGSDGMKVEECGEYRGRKRVGLERGSVITMDRVTETVIHSEWGRISMEQSIADWECKQSTRGGRGRGSLED